jgi:hypothetical protein
MEFSDTLLAQVNVVCANRHRADYFTFDIASHPLAGRDIRRVNVPTVVSRKPVDFVRPQAWIEGIGLENTEGLPRGLLLFLGQSAPTSPKGLISLNDFLRVHETNYA